ncbi:MAG: hypothetical protein F4X83_00295 [Chloroflexi bacterium]|nr:hypothetical protein [Chloroflexota bacterium]
MSGTGVEIIPCFADPSEVAVVAKEAGGLGKEWLDAHETYQNKRGLEIVQNHFTFALKLSRGDQSFLDRLPNTVALKEKTQDYVNEMSAEFPSLENWEADELSFHLYDDQEVGLSRHRDNLRFIGLVAIVAIEGECDLVITHKGQDMISPVLPGDLCLLRAPGLIDTDEEIRPEHSVQNLKTETRLSMMLRANDRPAEAIPGFKFNNWDPGQTSD